MHPTNYNLFLLLRCCKNQPLSVDLHAKDFLSVEMISFFSLLVLLQLGALVHAQQGFLSLACGTTPDFIYKDTIGISYISDAQFVETGTTQKIADYVIPPHPAYSNLRNFPDGARNCYNLKPVNNGNKYMVRTSFLYGNYDGLNRPPVFDVHVGVNFWKMINITSPTVAFWYEITMVAMSNSISLCFVNVGMGIPFVNIIDVRPINNVMYSFIVDTTHALSFYNRKNFGGNGIRYPDDVYDRPWNAIDDPSWTHISSSSSVNVSATITDPPEAVMRTAVYPTNDSTLAFRFQMDTGLSMEPSIFIMHFAELEELSKNKSRKFSINVNGYHWYGPFSPKYLTAEPIYPATPTATSWWLFSLEQSSDSTLPPAINGIELYFVKHFMLLETNSGDVDAINNVKEVYNIKRNWNGDPCLPISYAWEGLNCSNTNVSSPPQIISLNLSFSGLHGDISSSFANLMFLQILDLSSNNLTGQIPSILAELPSLKFLYLDGNQLNGPIPAALLDKANNGSLFLSARVGDDLDECKQQDKCKRHKKTALLIAVISSLIAAVVIISTLMGIRKLITRRGVIKTSDEMCNPQSSNTDPEPRDISQRQLELNQTEEIMEPVEASGSSYLTASDGWQFSYDQIVRITNRFETPIGEGGFGEVFVGFLSNGTRVAVKKLKTSRQDNVSLQFQNEVQLLMKVQHDNLVPFNGYCDDGVHKALVCKFMPGGDLKKYLSGTSDNRARLNWKKRIEIALGSARGLEYLHNQLHIVHRDVKPENILLNENLEAKIADFGLGRILSDENVTRIVTERVAGTIGYLDPEYYSNQVLSYKSDVYSFGVVLLQLITGKPPVISISPTEGIHITHWLDSRLDQTDIVDPSFAGNYHMMSVRKAIKLGKECTRSKSAERPAMKNVVLELETCLNIENNRNIQASR